MNLLKTLSYSALVGAAVAFAPFTAASTIIITDVDGVWTSTTGGNVTGVGTSQIRWGGMFDNPKSGYDFDDRSTPFGVALVTPFELGTFTHLNNPISAGTSITAATLKITTDLTIDGNPFEVDSFFDFAHWETPNGDNPCANGGANGSGVNSNGCADRVKFTLNVGSSESFFIGTTEYVVNISSFLISGNPATEFWTKEERDNSAKLQGSIVEKASVVPIPAAAWLFGSALMGMTGLGYRRRRAA